MGSVVYCSNLPSGPFRLHANLKDPVCVLIHDDPLHEVDRDWTDESSNVYQRARFLPN